MELIKIFLKSNRKKMIENSQENHKKVIWG